MIEQCLTSPPTQYKLSGRRFLQVKRPNQQYQSTEGKSRKENKPENTKNTVLKEVLKEKRYKSKDNPEKTYNTKYSNTIKRHT